MKKKLLASMALSMGLIMLASADGASAEKRVVIDPGHGGRHTGTCGLTGNITRVCERDVNLLVSLKLQSLLEDKGYDVRMTRETDKDFSSYISGNGGDLDMRMRYANSQITGHNDQTIFISVHHNGHPRSPYAKGTETYYYDGLKYYDSRWPHDPLQIKYLPDSKRLAQEIHPKMVSNLKTIDRGIHADEAFYVIRNAQSPSVLLELGFMTNAEEEARIKTSDFQWAAAKAVTNGVDEYFKVFEVYNSKNERLAVKESKEEAIQFANTQNELVTVFDKFNQKSIYDNENYIVYYGKDLSERKFYSYEKAYSYAKSTNESYIVNKENGWILWSNTIKPIYSVYQSSTKQKDYYDYNQALNEAKKLSNGKIIRKDSSEILWSSLSNDAIQNKPSVQELSGLDRIKTSIEVSKSLYPNGFDDKKEQKVVLLATGYDSADALSAGPLSSKYGQSPLLLSEKATLNSAVKNEIQRLGANKVLVIGGHDAISKQVESGIRSMNVEVERIEGSDRYATNLEILKKLGNVNGYFVTSGDKFADSLSVAPIATAQNWGIVLTKENEIPSSSLSLINGKVVRVIGGEEVIGSSVENTVKQAASNFKRLAGEDRYKTLTAVLWEFKNSFKSDSIFLTTGENFPDALAASSLAVSTKAPLILTGPKMDQGIRAFLMNHGNDQRILNVKVIGGTLKEEIVKDTTYLVK
ncbi:cell wall-binding repeat-containing protein [Rossellomorea arthrocnemi]